MATYYIFKASTDSALMVTADKTGANLPKHQSGSWEFFRECDFNNGAKGNIGASDDEVIDAVLGVGYYKC
ncbi:MAG TPA: hypothetical protein VMF32_20495 [Xanthobacteraceae bacterium]|nr:hypothetical protein [Xanthobacteraceae bacterium]